jgi:hypothetical protein
LELVIWRVPTTPRPSSGVRYRLAFARRNEEKPPVVYDNRHLEGVEQTYASWNVDKLMVDFMADVRRIIEDHRWPRR